MLGTAPVALGSFAKRPLRERPFLPAMLKVKTTSRSLHGKQTTPKPITGEK